MSTRMQVTTASSRMPGITPVSKSGIQRQCACGRHTHGGVCGGCAKGHATLQLKPVASAIGDALPPIVNDVLRSPGQPLDGATRAFMEPRFGYDFSGVTVHNDHRAAQSARDVRALAYTVGSDIVFQSGQYGMFSSSGRQLLTHELAHVVQQDGARPKSQTADGNSAGKIALGPKNDALETEAELAARRVESPRLSIGKGSSTPRLQRAPAGETDSSPSGTAPPATTQPAPAPATAPGPAQAKASNPAPIENFIYQSADQIGTFDAALDRSACLLTITKKLSFNFIDNPPVENWGTGFGPWPAGEAERFQSTFLRQVAQEWSLQHTLVPETPPCQAESCPSVRVAVRAIAVPMGQQHTALTIGYKSDNAPPPGMGVKPLGDTARLHSGEIQPRTVDGSTQLVSAHEFGHMLGLSHSNVAHCGTNHNDPKCYDPYDIMGKGSEVSERDYAPFTAVLNKFNSCSWKATSDPSVLEKLLKFFVSSPIGRPLGLAALGAGIGALAGHGAGALIGAGIGLGAGLISDLFL